MTTRNRARLADAVRATIPMTGTPGEGGAFEIVAITAGEGNGMVYPASVLMAAVPLFSQVQCFLDHVPLDSMEGHSVRDIAGILTDPVWDESLQGIRCKLTPFGAGADILVETAKQILALEGVDTKVGFSCDLEYVSEDGRNVSEIVQIYSVDMVVDPARGGAVLRALNNVRDQRAAARLNMQINGDNRSVRALLDANVQVQALNQEAAKARAVRAQMCQNLLDNTLMNCGLPLPMKNRIRQQLGGRVFEVEELNDAIADGRLLVTQLMSGEAVTGVSGRFSGMYNSSDQFSAAVHDMLGAKRPDGLRNVQVQPLSGIREMYTLMTGDYDFHGGVNRSRAQLSDTSDLPSILKNALNKLIAQRWEELGASGYRWWEPLVTVEHFNSMQPITGILVGEVSLLPSVSEGAAYTELDVSDNGETGSWNKYGGYLGLTIEMFERDDTMKLRQFPFKLATAGLRNISALVASVFTSNSGVGPVMADTHNVFDAENHSNVLTSALSSSAWEAACAAIYNQNMLVASEGTAPKLAVDGRYCLVPRALRLTAQRILYPSLTYESNIMSENMQRGQYGDVVTCPEFTDANDWAVVADPMLAPAIYIGERFGLMPEIYIADNQLTGALFTNDEVRIKARHFLSVFVADYRPLLKSNVA